MSDLPAAHKLGDLLASLEVNDNWSEVATTARSLADDLRTRGSDDLTALGKSMLPQTLTSLLKATLEGTRVPDDTRSPAVLELLRVGANLCRDHNDNRGFLLDAQFPQNVVSLLEGFVEILPANPAPQPLSISNFHLMTIKIAIGALLNLSLDYEPVQTRLISLEVPVTLLQLSIAIYPPGAWQSYGSSDIHDTWSTRVGITEWAWKTISVLKDNQAEQPLFGPESLPSLVVPLRAFIPPFSAPSGAIHSDSQLRYSLLACDVEVLEEVSELLESLTMDVEDVRLALARGMALHEEPPCLELMLDFVQSAEYVPAWSDSDIPAEEVSRWKKSVNLCKTAVIKGVVETAGEDNNLDVLFDLPNPGFVARMIKWIREAKGPEENLIYDDLVICASLSLGNLVRREQHSVLLAKPPISIVPHLVTHLTPSTDLKVKHGIIGLLKHLSQTASNRSILGDARVLEALRSCEVFSDNSDIAEIVQMAAINLAKHMCTNNVANAIICVLDAEQGQTSTSCLNQILALSRRSNSVPVKSEGARVLVNVVKSLCASAGDAQDQRRQSAIQKTLARESANALAQLLGRSRKHVVLLNESIVAMSLLAMHSGGAVLILDALLAELPKEVNPPSRQNSLNLPGTGSNPSSPIVGPRTALDMLVAIVNNSGNSFPAELRSNLCTLLGELGKESHKAESGGREREVEKLRAATRPGLEAAQSSPNSLVLGSAAKKALEAW